MTMAHFTPIDLNTWPRREHFHYFAHMAPTGYSLPSPATMPSRTAGM